MLERTARERDLIARAKSRLDRLAYYPRPVDVRHVRLVSAPGLFRLPWFRRFHGYDIGPLLLFARPLDEVSEDLVTHELCHAWQAQHRIVRMWLSYLWQGYARNTHELEARRAVDETRAVSAP
jgi:hypothetical protein